MTRSILEIIRDKRIKVPLNFIFYNLSWFITLISAAQGNGNLGLVSALVAVLLHLLLINENWLSELKFIILAILVGSLLDSWPANFGYVNFSNPKPALFGQYPLWMGGLWAGFATTPSVSLRWLRKRYFLAALFGALGGPASLYAGSKLGAVTFNENMTTILLYNAVEWTWLIPMILYLHEMIIPSSPSEKALPN